MSHYFWPVSAVAGQFWGGGGMEYVLIQTMFLVIASVNGPRLHISFFFFLLCDFVFSGDGDWIHFKEELDSEEISV